jgi:hypothetical protein
MLNENTRPSTIGGIKRLAKQIKKSSGIPHHEALDSAARTASFENFAHARNQLGRLRAQGPTQQLFFTSYWYDRNERRIGHEVVEIEISKPLLQMLSKNEIKGVKGLGKFRLAVSDHLVDDFVARSQETSRDRICQAVRALRFIEATGLKPNRNVAQSYPDGSYQNKPPQADHSTHWYDPATGQTILIDEPYLAATVDSERAEWAKRHNWHLQASTWPGMHYPGMTHLFVATDASSEFDFQSLMNNIDSIPNPLTIENWSGESLNGHDAFYSPLCLTENDKKRAVAEGTKYRTASKKTLPMRTWGAPFNERRPNAVMPVKSHQLAAKLLNALQQSSAKPNAVNTRLSSIKNDLNDWFFSEHKKSVTDKFELFYYESIDRTEPLALRASSVKGVMSLLHELKSMLLDAYVDCEPLRKMVSKIDTSIKLTSKLL